MLLLRDGALTEEASPPTGGYRSIQGNASLVSGPFPVLVPALGGAGRTASGGEELLRATDGALTIRLELELV